MAQLECTRGEFASILARTGWSYCLPGHVIRSHGHYVLMTASFTTVYRHKQLLID